MILCLETKPNEKDQTQDTSNFETHIIAIKADNKCNR